MQTTITCEKSNETHKNKCQTMKKQSLKNNAKCNIKKVRGENSSHIKKN